MSMVTKAPLTSSTSLTSPTVSPLPDATDGTSIDNSSTSWNWSAEDQQFESDITAFFVVIGSLEMTANMVLNVLLLTAILTSPLLRSRMRNRLLINVALADLTAILLSGPLLVSYSIRLRWVHNCFVTIIYIIMCMVVQNFLCTWGMVAVLTHYLARRLRYEGPEWVRHLSPGQQTALPALFIASPWIVSVLVLVPMIFGGSDHSLMTYWNTDYCPLRLQVWAEILLNIVSYILPALILICLVVAIVILAWRRRAEYKKSGVESAGEEGGGVLSGGRGGVGDVMSDVTAREDLEGCSVHVLTAALTILMMGPFHAVSMMPYVSGRSMVIFYLVAFCLGDILLPAILPLIWIFMLPDIRQRVREMALKVADYLPSCCRSQSPPQSAGNTSVKAVVFRDLRDE